MGTLSNNKQAKTKEEKNETKLNEQYNQNTA